VFFRICSWLKKRKNYARQTAFEFLANLEYELRLYGNPDWLRAAAGEYVADL
jgi:hypothetical protein